MDGRVAIVTGASRGLGRATAVALAAAGATTVLAARDGDGLAKVVDDIRRLGARTDAVPTDVTRSDDVDALVAHTSETFGRLDVLVNNAGILQGAPVLHTTDEDLDALLATNVRGAFHCVRAAGRVMVAQGSGKVVNVASAFASMTVRNFAAYSMTKAAVVQLTRVLAREWAPHGIQVNAVAPGYFATDMNAEARADEAIRDRILRDIPLQRFGEPEELGPLMVLLASSASDYMTGAVIALDGGLRL